MYKKGIYKILANEPLTASVWRMVLEGDTEWIVRPGQFVNIALEGRYLRRPISVCDCDARTLTLIYKVVGGGTEQMSRMAAGAELDLLTGLGNGFDTSNDARRPLLVGGGVGVPPLYKLAKALLAEGKPVSVVLGFNTADEIFYADEFRALGCDVHVATADGSAGTKGFVKMCIRDRAGTACEGPRRACELRNGAALSAALRRGFAGGRTLQDESAAAQPRRPRRADRGRRGRYD